MQQTVEKWLKNQKRTRKEKNTMTITIRPTVTGKSEEWPVTHYRQVQVGAGTSYQVAQAVDSERFQLWKRRRRRRRKASAGIAINQFEHCERQRLHATAARWL